MCALATLISVCHASLGRFKMIVMLQMLQFAVDHDNFYYFAFYFVLSKRAYRIDIA